MIIFLRNNLDNWTVDPLPYCCLVPGRQKASSSNKDCRIFPSVDGQTMQSKGMVTWLYICIGN